MKPTYNSINVFENLMTIIDKEGKMQVTAKEVIEVCRFLETVYLDGFCKGYNILKEVENNEFDLYEIREKYNLTQEQLSLKTGISRAFIAQIETGRSKTSKRTDKKIQDFLNNNPL